MEKTEYPGFFKAQEGVIINRDKDALVAYRKKRMREKKIDEIECGLKEIQSEMCEIKQLLKRIVNGSVS